MVSVDGGTPMVLGRICRRSLFAISLVLAFAELITGLIAQQRDEWILPWVVCVDILIFQRDPAHF